MTVLPIVERELRVRARSSAAYWSRFGIGLVALIFCLPALLAPVDTASASMLGRHIFNGLAGTALLLCCGASLLTADVISRERREGTLGLLLLTRVRTFDVLLGKLSSGGIASLCALVAFLPLLMIPLLAGGVNGAEAVRIGAALLNTLFFALTVGLWASSSKTDRADAVRLTIKIMAALLVLPLFLNFAPPPFSFVAGASPLTMIMAASGSLYQFSQATSYWSSLALVQVIGWLFVRSAAKNLVRLTTEGATDAQATLEELTLPPRVLTLDVAARLTPIEADVLSAALRRRRWIAAADLSPVEWLVRRQRGIMPMLWAGTLLGFLNYGIYFLLLPAMGFGYRSYSYVVGNLPSLALSIIGGACFAWVATRFFVEARRTGELELLLSTPVGARTVISDQWKALKHFMIWPALVLTAVGLLRLIPPLLSGPAFQYGSPVVHLATLALAAVNSVAVFVAICWVGLWFGLKARGQAAAVLWTAAVVKGLPYVLGTIVSLVLRMSLGGGFGAPPSFRYSVVMCLPSLVVFLTYIWMIGAAWRRLTQKLVGCEVPGFALRKSVRDPQRETAKAIQKARDCRTS